MLVGYCTLALLPEFEQELAGVEDFFDGYH